MFEIASVANLVTSSIPDVSMAAVFAMYLQEADNLFNIKL